jgi:P4 family phage/plasmid primase-like protien
MVPDHVYEMRCLTKNRSRTGSGYFLANEEGIEACVNNALFWSKRDDTKGVYLTLNPCKPDLIGRSVNSVEDWAKTTTAVKDILNRSGFVLDFDPITPVSGVCSTDQEHEAAIEKASVCRDILTRQGFPLPMWTDSGNGSALIYAIDLPNDAASADLIQSVLAKIGEDLTVFNASRITRLPGTWNRKGDNAVDLPGIVDRPQRMARIIESPDHLEVVTAEQLRSLLSLPEGELKELRSLQPVKETSIVDSGPKKKKRPATSSATSTPSTSSIGENPEVTEWLEERFGVIHHGPEGENYKWCLEKCPWSEDHSTGEGDAAIWRLKDHSYGFKCLHDSCCKNGRHIRDIYSMDGFPGDGEKATAELELLGLPTSSEELEVILKAIDTPLSSAVNAASTPKDTPLSSVKADGGVNAAPYATPEEPKGKRQFDDAAKIIYNVMVAAGKIPLATGGRVYIYTGTHYRPQEEMAKVVRSYFKKWGWRQSNNIIGNVVPIIESYCWLDKSVVGPMPFWRNGPAPFDAKNLVTYQNGLLDLATSTLHPHTPAWCSTYCLPYEYDPSATCPVWRTFLNDVYEGDVSRADLLQEYAGYCLCSDTSFQKALVLVGKPRSGKGTIQRVFKSLVGQENSTGFALEKLATEFGLSGLVDKSLALVPEVELSGSKDRNKIVESWKSIIGEDSMMVNIKHCPQMVSLTLPTRFLVSANSVPRLMDASGALLARLLFIPHDVSFLGREDLDLDAKLSAELPGIANWALEGLKRLRQQARFTVGDGHTTLSTRFATDTTPVLQWLRDCVLVSRSCDPGDLPSANLASTKLTCSKSKLYTSYENWCAEHDVQASDIRYWSQDLQRLVPKLRTLNVRTEKGRERVFAGVGLKVMTTDEEDIDTCLLAMQAMQ